MLIAIDVGNTRIKWGVYDNERWLAQGALLSAEVLRLAEILPGWSGATAVIASNVAGQTLAIAIDQLLKQHQLPPAQWLRASAAAGGVSNGYAEADQLGSDRWAALLGARAHTLNACLVVCAGTATTVDWLAENGVFRGGLILPGFDLMRRSLARNTAQLPWAEGEFCAAPQNTADAITSGCLHAQAGAIERMYRQMQIENSTQAPQCLLTGGAAPRIGAHLSIDFRVEENLILDGLRRSHLIRR